MLSNTQKFFSRALLHSRRLAFFSQDREALITKKLQEGLEPSTLEVVDQSGGCGTMYHFKIESPKFKGKTRVEQHKIVAKLLEEELKGVHGYTLKTSETK